VGYGAGGESTAATNVKATLEGRKAFLEAELARTEALLGAATTSGGAQPNEDALKWTARSRR
jgi:hypothetical protein